MSPMLNSNEPYLSAFFKGGGKLMLYHGWNDAPIPAGATLDCYAALRAKLGSVAEQQARLFMIPGMMHCAGGPGPNTFDMVGEMDRWVESGSAPERIVAAEYNPPAISHHRRRRRWYAHARFVSGRRLLTTAAWDLLKTRQISAANNQFATLARVTVGVLRLAPSRDAQYQIFWSVKVPAHSGVAGEGARYEAAFYVFRVFPSP